jgi:3-phenylpropionate/trans-cinnamate dioxygenase ferredoxin reductase component
VSGSRPGRVVIVGASLAGLRGAESLRRMGFTGSLTIVGDEPHEPYDRPPLSKAALRASLSLPGRRQASAGLYFGTASGVYAVSASDDRGHRTRTG